MNPFKSSGWSEFLSDSSQSILTVLESSPLTVFTFHSILNLHFVLLPLADVFSLLLGLDAKFSDVVDDR